MSRAKCATAIIGICGLMLILAMAIEDISFFLHVPVDDRMPTAPVDLNVTPNRNHSDSEAELMGIHEYGIASIRLSPDGTTLITTGIRNTTCVWDLRAKQRLWSWDDGPWQKASVEFSRDGQFFFAGGIGSAIDIRKTSNWHVIGELREANMSVNAIAISADSKLLYSADLSVASITVWSLDNKTVLLTFKGPNLVRDIRLTEDGRNLYAIGHEEVWVIDPQDGKCLLKTPGHAHTNADGQVDRIGTEAVDYCARKKIIATAGVDHRIVIWKTEPFKKWFILEGHEWDVTLLAFSPDGKYLVSGNSSEIYIWNLEVRMQIRHIRPICRQPRKHAQDFSKRDAEGPDVGPSGLAISSDGRFLFIGNKSGQIFKYDLQKMFGQVNH